MSYFICFLFSIFIAVALGFLKIHGYIDLSWFWIGIITLFWEIPAIAGGIAAVFAIILAVILCAIAVILGIGIIMLPFGLIGLAIYFSVKRIKS